MAKISIKRRIERATSARNVARDAVYAAAEHGNMTFAQCLAIAPSAVADAYHSTIAELDAAERVAIDAGKAYRSPTSRALIFYR